MVPSIIGFNSDNFFKVISIAFSIPSSLFQAWEVVAIKIVEPKSIIGIAANPKPIEAANVTEAPNSAVSIPADVANAPKIGILIKYTFLTSSEISTT